MRGSMCAITVSVRVMAVSGRTWARVGVSEGSNEGRDRSDSTKYGGAAVGGGSVGV